MNLFPILPAPTPLAGQIGGHEGINLIYSHFTLLTQQGVGIVVSHGPDVTWPPIGSRVGIKYAADACLTCDKCIEGGESSCRNGKVSGYFTPGTFQQYCLAPARYLTPVPDGLELSAAAPLMCGGLTVYTALKRAGLCPGHWVAVCGAGGGLGHLGIQYARAMGGRVIALDVGSKKELCCSVGADEFLDFTKFESDSALAAKVKQLTNGGARIALMCASSGKAYAQAMSWLGFRGTLLCLGIPDHEGCLVPNITAMVTDELRIIATKTGNQLDARECLEIAAQGHVKVRYQIRKMDELTKASLPTVLSGAS
ncbi:Alcohol dehydrogenase 2 [Tolypocladium ophioglossoides CBS 100239]|uniref:Alcohol dehydrogenase 2 n=1 Tax=Tolypocladium ophioglossoides (strain CBS 100239) TaxID=1163406 RepID=A0A0L0N8T7_TOLOC|nr:Alcohol dehydrogenase 2 [Tolypocladium ophioglossoides CBS 100239]